MKESYKFWDAWPERDHPIIFYKCRLCNLDIVNTKTWAGMDYYYKDFSGSSKCTTGAYHKPSYNEKEEN